MECNHVWKESMYSRYCISCLESQRKVGRVEDFKWKKMESGWQRRLNASEGYQGRRRRILYSTKKELCDLVNKQDVIIQELQKEIDSKS